MGDDARRRRGWPPIRLAHLLMSMATDRLFWGTTSRAAPAVMADVGRGDQRLRKFGGWKWPPDCIDCSVAGVKYARVLIS